MKTRVAASFVAFLELLFYGVLASLPFLLWSLFYTSPRAEYLRLAATAFLSISTVIGAIRGLWVFAASGDREFHVKRDARLESVLGLIALALMAVLVVGLYVTIDWLHERSCPASTFLYGGIDLGFALTIVPWGFAGLWSISTGLRTIVYRLSWADQPLCVVSAVGSVVVALALSIFGAGAAYCVWPEGLSVRANTFSSASVYPWEGVRRIEPSCYGGRSTPRFDLVLADGTKIDLARSPRALVRNFAAVELALRDVPYVYDRSRITAACGARPDLKQVLLRGAHTSQE
jgi:hypothetical protein